MKKTNEVYDMVLAAMFLALGLVLPFITGHIQQIGQMLLPMHIPVLLCGLICGWRYGGIVGATCPLLRAALFSMPPMYPTAIAMAFELAAYGVIAGYLYQRSRWQCVAALYRCLIAAMIGGRIVWGVACMFLYGMGGNGFTVQMFLAGALFNAIPGIILQLILIPAIMVALHRAGLVRFQREPSEI